MNKRRGYHFYPGNNIFILVIIQELCFNLLSHMNETEHFIGCLALAGA
jgi:hypothetical protein